jgi:acetylornithine/succinyldiaminopimelate/putrescine aminotransferase
MYIDLTAGGIFAAMFGVKSEEIWERIWRVKYSEICSYSPHRKNYWREGYISMLKKLTGFESVALFTTGSEATEAFWRACRVYNGKPGIWGGLIDPDEVGTDHPKCDAMHGVTLGSLIMAGKMSWLELGYFPELGEERFGKRYEATSCMIMEPYHAPSAQFHRISPTIERIASLQKEFPDIPLCLDEIQGGFGRTGKLWAHEHYVKEGRFLLNPDFITIGKLCGGGLPLSALLGPKEIMESEVVKEHAHLHSTHSGNPLMCAVGCKVIEEMKEQRLIERSAELGERMHSVLSTFPVRTHGKGLLAGIEMADNGEVKKVTKKCLERGVQVCDTGRKWVKIGPQLNIEEEMLMKGISILKEIIEEVVDERKSEARGTGSEGPETSDSHLLPAGVQDNREGNDKSGKASGPEGKYN